MAAAQNVTYRLDGPLHPSVCAKVEAMLSLSANALGKKMGCRAAQAEALQLYLLATLVMAYRRSQGVAPGEMTAKAAALLRRLPQRVRDDIRELL